MAIENRARAEAAAAEPSTILATIKALGDYSEAERMLEYKSVRRDAYNCVPFDSFPGDLYVSSSRAEFNVDKTTCEVATSYRAG